MYTTENGKRWTCVHITTSNVDPSFNLICRRNRCAVRRPVAEQFKRFMNLGVKA